MDSDAVLIISGDDLVMVGAYIVSAVVVFAVGFAFGYGRRGNR